MQQTENKKKRIQTEIPGVVIYNSEKHFVNKKDGWAYELVDFSEPVSYLGYQFDPRSMFVIQALKGVVRGGHLEGRSKFVSILSGSVYYVVIDMRPGVGQGKVAQFTLGEDVLSIGQSVLLPEGVVDAFVPTTPRCLYTSVADQPFNLFDSMVSLDLSDPVLDIRWPQKVQYMKRLSGHETLSYSDFIKSI